jgi:ribosomal protein S18 acetylase RimI-like enzyme
VGLVGLQIPSGAKQRHKAHLFSMYVDAAHRGTGLAGQLVEAVIAAARAAGAVVIHLTVEAGNQRAQRLYRRLGFSTYGVERRSLRVENNYHDEELMALDLDQA